MPTKCLGEEWKSCENITRTNLLTFPVILIQPSYIITVHDHHLPGSLYQYRSQLHHIQEIPATLLILIKDKALIIENFILKSALDQYLF